jgi:hypothetical protein
MKTDHQKTLITSAVTAAILLLAFHPASAFNPQPEPPAGEDRVAVPAATPETIPKPTVRVAPAPQPTPAATPLTIPTPTRVAPPPAATPITLP